MKKIHIIIALYVISAGAVFGQAKNQTYLNYIGQYAPLAVEQRQLHKIPASIKLAQGLLESGAGTGDLARSANNHFGIKCTNWTGQKTYADDDAKGECFRKYNTVRESYEDHSLFLASRPRYASLFSLKDTDYKGWAHGLKAAGYATDANYAHKLIKLIEDYDLTQYDNGAGNYASNRLQTDGRAALKGHDVYRNNKTKCVFAEAGDTYSSIANEFGISEKKILEYNDLSRNETLEQGTVVYLGKKKNKASKEYSTHTVQVGENMYRIAQKYGIRLQELYDLNNIPYSEGAKVNMVLKLR